MKQIIIGDLHLGIKDSNQNFITYQNKFFEEVLFHHMKDKDPNEYELVFLGDIFHNRRVMNIKTMHQIFHLFQNLQHLFHKINIIVGNHDLYFRNSYELSASELMLDEIIPNTKMFQGYSFDETTDNLYVNWRNSREEYLDLFDEIDITVRKKVKRIYGHFELFNFKFNATIANDDDRSLSETDLILKFPNTIKIYSGHFHSPQKSKFTNYVGVPYQLTWSEYGEKLGFYELDLDTNIETFIANPHNIFEFLNFKTKKSINEYIIDDDEYKKIYKIHYHKETLKDLVISFMDKLSVIGHNVILVNSFNKMIADFDDNVDENQLGLSMESLLEKYINDELEFPNKEIFFKMFMRFYQKTKNEMGQNIELM